MQILASNHGGIWVISLDLIAKLVRTEFPFAAGDDAYSVSSTGDGSVSVSQVHDSQGLSSSRSLDSGPSISFHGGSGDYAGEGSVTATWTESVLHQNRWTLDFVV